MVGFQTRLTYAEQKRIIGMIPALSSARYLRYGSIHRNTYLDSPRVLGSDLSLLGLSNTYLAGQIMGVEGYMESAATGILAGISLLGRIKGKPFHPPGTETALGALMHYITDCTIEVFQPMNINFGIMATPDVPKNRRSEARSVSALLAFTGWKNSLADIEGLNIL
jgi:methylenetetrahydrofolate--tRNA-(uracil-5-)-methyltransferase